MDVGLIAAILIVLVGLGLFIYGCWHPTDRYQKMDAQNGNTHGTGEAP